MKAKRNSCMSTNDFNPLFALDSKLAVDKVLFFDCELLKSAQNDSFHLNQKSGLKIN